MRRSLVFSLFCLPLFVWGQFDPVFQNPDWENKERAWQKKENLHLAHKDLQIRHAFSSDSSWRNKKFQVAPFYQAATGVSSQLTFEAAIGFHASWKLSKKLHYSGQAGLVAWRPPSYFFGPFYHLNAMPIAGRSYAYSKFAFSPLSSHVLSLKLNKVFTVKGGYGRNFVGDGLRSVLLDHQHANYPFVQLKTTFWKVQYTNLFMGLQATETEPDPYALGKKFVSAHHLSWNITPWFNFGVFESIVWLGKDTLTNRGLDINYFNPIIFYRPVEYAQGSADNALLGSNMKFKLAEDHQLYTQFMLDEFLLDSLRARNGWWANKYAIQVGYKWFNTLGKPGWKTQFEFNVVRPFTYSHGNTVQSYGHHQAPLAHPYGANFFQFLLLQHMNLEKFNVSAALQYYVFGGDPDESSWGGDVFKSYIARTKESGHSIGQGERHQVFMGRVRLSKALSKNRGEVYVGLMYREAFKAGRTSWIQVGIRKGLYAFLEDATFR